MRMSEAYAGAVAGLVPVVLLVITVEIAGNRSYMQGLFAEMGRPVALARSLARRERLTRQQAERARQAAQGLARGMRNVLALLGYLLVSVIVAGALFDAELRALQWLASPQQGADEADARFCFYALAVAFARIVIGPVINILHPLVEGTKRLLPGVIPLVRLSRLTARTNEEQQADTA
ncbi:hypothetical protein ACFWBR_24360 [Streptomyces sp. NPDC060006]|uniref:hypothetical protein n=1 Tax=unclassified Streptomyces TaxID=2593676 RepID=UPI0036CA4F77